ncbi:cupin domain-containing protein [Ectopseudomonas hydrolytica]|uniref:cupin domain-containing protein n=1 Tax=Ectopseudomonas hydrolytica TaxID=2493633 RepID=UPI0010FC0A7F|nr:cupin domain-containing protein [Pseudomonas hydrolytica]ARS49287.1 cupin [Pseudomonas mendocina]MBF8164656.1 cupin domain-containing protein [Pseudomonas mendocina]UTH29611.1 cupin domain-containing protein [Pseudomonas hydrolytica]UZZ08640.1 cupin domain-containing protein [Pseudomonas mendocina]
MRYPHLLAAALALTAFAGLAQADQHQTESAASANWKQGIQRTDLTRDDLGDSVHEVIQARVDFDPGVASPNHSHPGVEVAYVIEGTFEYRLKGRAPVILKAGESLYIPAGTPHIATNIGEGKASELATYIVKKGTPLLVLEQ